MQQGKLIVIDGADGSGKATQTNLLAERLKSDGIAVETLDFPRYSENVCGKLLRECFDGKRGDFMQVDARIASVLFAADRFESKERIENWLAEGKTVILDRYVSANMMHQGAKISEENELHEFLDWLDTLEHGMFKIPRPDLILYMAVPQEMRRKLKEKAVEEEKHGKGVKIDLAEADEEHQRATEDRAKTIVQGKNSWQEINCTQDGVMRSREEIHEDVYACVMNAIQ